MDYNRAVEKFVFTSMEAWKKKKDLQEKKIREHNLALDLKKCQKR